MSRHLSYFALLIVFAIAQTGCGGPISAGSNEISTDNLNSAVFSDDKDVEGKKMETATLGAGCFWCVEAVFQQLEGVASVQSGYMGGEVENPTYRQICTGQTGHAEVCQIKFDPVLITFDELLEVFWQTHDPTTLNRQGPDTGTQYRSAVFYHDEKQKEIAEAYKKKLNDEKVFRNPVVTEVTAASKFYVAEDYHQNYWDNNPTQGYCRAYIPPKLEKLKKVFGDKLKKTPTGK